VISFCFKYLNIALDFFYFSNMTKAILKTICISFFLCFAFLARAQEAAPDSASVVAMQNDTSKCAALLKLSEAALTHNFESGKRFAQDALKLATKLNFKKGIYKAHVQIARCESYLGNFKEAFDAYKIAYDYYVKIGDKRGQAALLNRMGETKRALDEYEEALEYLQASLELNRELGDTNEMGSCFISIGILHGVRGNQKKSESYFLQAIDCFKAIKNEPRRYLTILNMASLYNEMNEYDKAIEFGLMALDYLLANGPEIRVGVCYFNLATSHEKKNELVTARKYYLKGLEIFDRLGDKYRVNGAIIGISKIDFKLGNTSLALANANKGLEGAKEVGSLSLQISAYDHLSNIYFSQKNFEKSLANRLLYQDLVDSVNSTETKANLAELEEKYQSKLRERELAETKADLEVQALKLTRQQVQQRILIGIAVGIAVILLLLVIQFRTNKKYSHVLEEKNELIEKSLADKEVLLKEIHHRVKNNLQFISSMLNLQARHVKDEHALAVLLESKSRIHSMALVHQKLYQEENLTGVNMQDYLSNLLDSLQHAYKIQKENIKVEVAVDPLELDIDTAMPIGLLINEMITNSFKYAFGPEQQGVVSVSLVEKVDGLALLVKDNGRGFTEQLEQVSADRFGFKLMKSLAEKLGGSLEITQDNGVRHQLLITNFKKV
jgi:two-component sensor histidine kinase